ncbi:MAG TPA: hypothetical protein VGE12_22145 [Noviherbaspirillum sp.]
MLAGISGARQALPLKISQPARSPVVVVIGAALHLNSIDDAELADVAHAGGEIMAALAGEEVVPASCCEP